MASILKALSQWKLSAPLPEKHWGSSWSELSSEMSDSLCAQFATEINEGSSRGCGGGGGGCCWSRVSSRSAMTLWSYYLDQSCCCSLDSGCPWAACCCFGSSFVMGSRGWTSSISSPVRISQMMALYRALLSQRECKRKWEIAWERVIWSEREQGRAREREREIDNVRERETTWERESDGMHVRGREKIQVGRQAGGWVVWWVVRQVGRQTERKTETNRKGGKTQNRTYRKYDGRSCWTNSNWITALLAALNVDPD